MAKKCVKINRAPVLTLWSAVVAERLGYDEEAALSIGKAVAGLNAQSKGRRLGIFEKGEARKEEREPRAAEQEIITVLSRPVPMARTPEGPRAAIKGEVIDSGSVRRYLEKKFGEELAGVRAAMEELAAAYSREELAEKAYSLYERFRPEIPPGRRGWGAEGELDLDTIRSLAR